MPRNNGIYAPPPSTWFPAVDGSPASPEDWNSLLSDIASALTQSISKDGQTQITGDLNFGGNQAQNLRAPSSNSEALRRAQIIKGADIEAAATIAIPDEGAVFVITGDAQIEAISGGFSGRIVVLRFSEDLLIKHSENLICPGGRDYFASEGGMAIMVKVDASVWQLFSTGSGYSFEVGDFLDTIRTPDASWLKRDGASYPVALYPELAALIPPVPPGFTWEVVALPAGMNMSSPKLSPGRTSSEVLRIAGQTAIDGFSLHATSDSGDSWTLIHQSTLSGDAPTTPIAFGNGVFVRSVYQISGQSGWVRYSSNGTTWSNAEALFGSRAEDLIWSERLGLFVIVGASGKIATSPDGVTWTLRVSIGSAGFFFVGEFDDTLIAVGSSGMIYTSSNAITWELKVSPVEGATLQWAGRIAGKWVVSTLQDDVYYTSDFSSWNAAGKAVTTGSGIGFFAQTDDYAVAVHRSEDAGFSVSGDVWQATDSPPGIELFYPFPDPNDPSKFLFSTLSSNFVRGTLTIDTDTFRVPSDNPVSGWIKAL